MLREHGYDVIVDRCGSAVRIIGTKMQGVHCAVRLTERAGRFTAAGYKFPHKGLGRQPFLIVTSCQAVTVSLVAIQKRQSDCFLLTI